MNYGSGLPPGGGSPSGDKSSLYTPGFPGGIYQSTQPGLPQRLTAQAAYPSVTQAYAPSYYTPTTGYPSLPAGYPASFQTMPYSSIQSIPSTTPGYAQSQYATQGYVAGQPVTSSMAYGTALPVTSPIYPASGYGGFQSVPAARGYQVSPMGYPSTLGTNPSYPGASPFGPPPY